MRKLIAFLLCAFCFNQAFAFGNEDVSKLISAKFPEEMVVKAISTATPATFDTSADGLIGLKNAGASDAVIQAVLARQGGGNSSQAGAPVQVNGGSCQLEAPTMDNMLVIRTEGKLIPVSYQTVEVVTNTDGFSALASYVTSGLVKAKGSVSLRVNGGQAKVRITERVPEFLDVLLPLGAAAEDAMYLVRMTAEDKARIVQAMSFESGITGNSGRSMDFGEGVRVPLVADKRSDQCTWQGKTWAQFRMKPAAPLDEGEYGFLIGKNLFGFAVVK